MLNVNLILSGGGARSTAHLGVIKALQEYDFNIKSISGVSSGAIVGAFAKGMTPEEVLEVAVENSSFNIRRPPFNLGLFSKTKMDKVLKRYFPENSFSALQIPLYVAATNINEGRTDYFSSGELIKPLEASSALPVLFAPVLINGYQYLDGGLLNNLPVEPFLKDDSPRIAVHVNPISKAGNLTRIMKVLERSIELVVFKNIRTRKKYCDLFLEPSDLEQFATYDFNKARQLFNIGYEYCRPRLDKFLKGGSFEINELNKMPMLLRKVAG